MKILCLTLSSVFLFWSFNSQAGAPSWTATKVVVKSDFTLDNRESKYNLGILYGKDETDSNGIRVHCVLAQLMKKNTQQEYKKGTEFLVEKMEKGTSLGAVIEFYLTIAIGPKLMASCTSSSPAIDISKELVNQFLPMIEIE